MQQHPVPQNVTSYQFRLVGDMTLKQFLELAGGIVLGYLFFISSLVFFIKWPLIILSVLTGVALAFFPIEERPLDQWIINFVKSVYSPTRFIWRRTSNPPAIFTFTKKQLQEKTDTIEKAQKTRAPQPVSMVQEEEMSDAEKSRLDQISSLFEQLTSKIPAPTLPQINQPKPPIKPSIRAKQIQPATTTKSKVIFDKDAQKPPVIERSGTPAPEPSESQPSTEPLTEVPTVTKEVIENVQKSSKIAENMPVMDKSPNTVVGLITDSEEKLIPNAIVEILDEEGVPQRAVKTNPLGQFRTATPLSPGKYVIQVEKDNLQFPQQEIKVTNKIIPPIHLQSTSAL